MLENQAPYLEGRESDIFTLLLQIRYSNKIAVNLFRCLVCSGDLCCVQVLEATNAIRDALTSRIEPVYGLTTMHASIRAYIVQPPPEVSNAGVKAASYAFGLIALAKFILRLPAEILDEELPRLKTTLISVSLNMQFRPVVVVRPTLTVMRYFSRPLLTRPLCSSENLQQL
jgi:CLIP-associating protein 1/2